MSERRTEVDHFIKVKHETSKHGNYKTYDIKNRLTRGSSEKFLVRPTYQYLTTHQNL